MSMVKSTSSVPPPKSARFLPSEALARLALAASLDQPEGGEEGSFALLLDRLEVAPEGPPAPDGSDLLERTRQSIGARVERLFADLAFEAAAQGQARLRISDGKRFTPLVGHELLTDLPVNPYQAGPILDGLQSELRLWAQSQEIGGAWGRVRDMPEGLFLEVIAPLHRQPADRPRAQVIGGVAQR